MRHLGTLSFFPKSGHQAFTQFVFPSYHIGVTSKNKIVARNLNLSSNMVDLQRLDFSRLLFYLGMIHSDTEMILVVKDGSLMEAQKYFQEYQQNVK